MQLGGNANAVSFSRSISCFARAQPLIARATANFLFIYLQTSFFRQHNCDTTDTQLKYKSRAAQLYRDKLHGEAAKAMRMHGTKLFIDAPQNSAQDDTVEVETKEDDFFDQHENEASTASVQLPQNVKLAVSFEHLLY